MYNFIVDNFLKSEIFEIKMAAIKCIGFILHSDIEKTHNQTLADRRSKQNIYELISRDQSVPYSEDAMDTDVADCDKVANEISSYLQLFSSIFCVNFILRKPIILEMTKLVLRYNLSEAMAQKMFNKVLAFLKCDAMSLMDSNSIVDLLSQCITNGINLKQ